MKKEQGVTIQLVIDDNEKNRTAEFLLDLEFSTQWLTIESHYKNIISDLS